VARNSPASPAPANPTVTGGAAPPWATDTGAPQPAGGGGAWQDQNNNWTWVPGSTPDPNLASAWGDTTLTDPTRNPNGVANTGAWLQSGHQWAWVWGATPDPNLVSQLGSSTMTNPDQTPNGQTVSGNPSNPAPPNVAQPSMSDTWGGVAPDVTGNVPPTGVGANNGEAGQQNMGSDASQNTAPNGSPVQAATPQPPPAHPPFVASPGDIRNAESTVIGYVDNQISAYNTLRSAVNTALSQNLAPNPATYSNLQDTANNLLQGWSDVITNGMGGLAGQLNSAAQNYAHADQQSAVPQS
jgi:hypothetical protein